MGDFTRHLMFYLLGVLVSLVGAVAAVLVVDPSLVVAVLLILFSLGVLVVYMYTSFHRGTGTLREAGFP